MERPRAVTDEPIAADDPGWDAAAVLILDDGSEVELPEVTVRHAGALVELALEQGELIAGEVDPRRVRDIAPPNAVTGPWRQLADRRRTVSRQTRQLVAELRRAPLGRGLFAGVLVGLAARALGADGGASRAAGLTVGSATWRTLASAVQLEREVRANQDGAIVGARLGAHCPPLGAWAIEADFAELVVGELQKRPRVVVELGSGVSTLVVAQQLTALGRGRLVSVEHHEEYAALTRLRLQRSGLAAAVELVHAPLVAQEFDGRQMEWYDVTAIHAALGHAPIDLLIVDGPPSITPLARWPAVAALGERLRPGSVIMLDDGRDKNEAAIARRWAVEHPDFELYWLDTVKGTWKLVRSDGSESASTKLARRVATALNPRPSGFGRWPLRRV